METYITEYKKSIPNTLCNEIIHLFENADGKIKGINIINGKNIKKDIELIIPKNDDKWINIENFLYKELFIKLNKYIKDKNKMVNEKIILYHFTIEKYEKEKGEYLYHSDFNLLDNCASVISFIWFLNDVDEGGEVTFIENHKIQPEQGKLLFFPSFWCYTYMNKIPLSSAKYIISGTLYN